MSNDPPRSQRQQDAARHCPNCQADGQPFEVEEGRGYRRVTYRCAKCHHTWAQTIARADEKLR